MAAKISGGEGMTLKGEPVSLQSSSLDQLAHGEFIQMQKFQSMPDPVTTDKKYVSKHGSDMNIRDEESNSIVMQNDS